MTDCSIYENHAMQFGGGVYILGAINLVRCKVHDNVAIGAGDWLGTISGAGLYLHGSKWARGQCHAGHATIVDSYIYQNRAGSKVEYAFKTRHKSIKPNHKI